MLVTNRYFYTQDFTVEVLARDGAGARVGWGRASIRELAGGDAAKLDVIVPVRGSGARTCEVGKVE